MRINDQSQKLGLQFGSLEIEDNYFLTVKIQLKALGLITKSVKKRSLNDTYRYWPLTSYGDTVMTRLRAIKKTTV